MVCRRINVFVDPVLSFAGLAQASIVIGIGGIVSLAAADFTRDAIR